MRGGISSDLGKEMLPIAGADEVDCRRDLTESDTGCYLAGDIRANEQVRSCVGRGRVLINGGERRDGFSGRTIGHAHDLDQGTQSYRPRIAKNQPALGRRRPVSRSAENRGRAIATYNVQTLVAVRARAQRHGTFRLVPRVRPDREPVHSQRFRDSRPEIRPLHHQPGAGSARRQLHYYTAGNVLLYRPNTPPCW